MKLQEHVWCEILILIVSIKGRENGDQTIRSFDHAVSHSITKLPFNMAASDDCIMCNKQVSSRQEALQCDGCQRWNHRICDTGTFLYL